ncbi:hypothetical protein ACC760_37845, partial [Rhizobium ruizarguesonis]
FIGGDRRHFARRRDGGKGRLINILCDKAKGAGGNPPPWPRPAPQKRDEHRECMLHSKHDP